MAPLSVSPPGTLTLECVGCRKPECKGGGCQRALALIDRLPGAKAAPRPLAKAA